MHSLLEIEILDNNKIITIAELESQFTKPTKEICEEVIKFAEANEHDCRLHYSTMVVNNNIIELKVKAYFTYQRPHCNSTVLYAVSSNSWVGKDNQTVLPSGEYPVGGVPRISLPPSFSTIPLSECPVPSKTKRKWNQNSKSVTRKQRQQQGRQNTIEIVEVDETTPEEPVIVIE